MADDELTPAASRALDTLFDANGPVVVETCAATVKSILQHILESNCRYARRKLRHAATPRLRQMPP